MQDSVPILEMKGITKVYGNGIVANNNVNFVVNKGEIHALIGENGAGKSTLMKILFGLEQPDGGHIAIKGKKVAVGSSNEAIQLGIGMVQQHFQQVASMTVAENLILGREPCRGLFFDRKKAVAICNEFSEKYQLPINAEAKVEDLSVSERQKLEILKALYGGAEILILDEPTAVLTPQEIEEFFNQLKILRSKGHTIIFITHRLREILEICDRMTVIRDGQSVGQYNVEGSDEKHISRLIVGRDVVLKVEKEKAAPKANVLKVQHLNVKDSSGIALVDDVSLSVREGEIVGIAAVEGNGQKELIEAITGELDYTDGIIHYQDHNVKEKSIAELRKLKLGYITEDRHAKGTAPGASVQDNLITLIRDKGHLAKHGFFNQKEVDKTCQRMIKQYEIKTDSKDTPVSMLSGGNMQKVVIARELDRNPPLLIAQQPTRGVDVGSIEFIHSNIIAQRDSGCAVLLVSADLSEVLALSDSIIVMHKGAIQAYFDETDGLKETDIGSYMLGLEKQPADTIKGAYHHE